MTILLIYIAIFVVGFLVVRFGVRRLTHSAADFTSLKTVTFGDESAVTADRAASVISVLAIFLIWGAFTGSKWSPIHAPGPFVGDASFTYTAEASDGSRDDATVALHPRVGKRLHLVHRPHRSHLLRGRRAQITLVIGPMVALGNGNLGHRRDSRRDRLCRRHVFRLIKRVVAPIAGAYKQPTMTRFAIIIRITGPAL